MGQTRAEISQLASKEVVLGLLIQEPDNSYRLDKRMKGMLGSAQYRRGTASQALKSLLTEGCVCPVGDDAAAAVDVSDGQPRGRYEVTEIGVEHFRRWLAASTLIPPVREELHAKIALCQPRDLPLLIGMVKEAELACMARLQAANRRAQQSEQDAVGKWEWKQRMGIVLRSSEAVWWDSRIKWLMEVRLFLQKEWETYRGIESRSRSG